jgi:hypothetical protein
MLEWSQLSSTALVSWIYYSVAIIVSILHPGMEFLRILKHIGGVDTADFQSVLTAGNV